MTTPNTSEQDLGTAMLLLMAHGLGIVECFGPVLSEPRFRVVTYTGGPAFDEEEEVVGYGESLTEAAIDAARKITAEVTP